MYQYLSVRLDQDTNIKLANKCRHVCHNVITIDHVVGSAMLFVSLCQVMIIRDNSFQTKREPRQVVYLRSLVVACLTSFAILSAQQQEK
jgi:hypothetical protein